MLSSATILSLKVFQLSLSLPSTLGKLNMYLLQPIQENEELYNLCVRNVCESTCEKGEGDESYVEGVRVVSGTWRVRVVSGT